MSNLLIDDLVFVLVLVEVFPMAFVFFVAEALELVVQVLLFHPSLDVVSPFEFMNLVVECIVVVFHYSHWLEVGPIEFHPTYLKMLDSVFDVPVVLFHLKSGQSILPFSIPSGARAGQAGYQRTS